MCIKSKSQLQKFVQRLFFIYALVLSICSSVSVHAGKVVLTKDIENLPEMLPSQFRIAFDQFLTTDLLELPTREGLDLVMASGSAQFSEQSLLNIVKKLGKDRLVIVDLRQESHGFMNGHAVSWYGKRNWANAGKKLEMIYDDETKRLKKARYIKKVKIKTGHSRSTAPADMYITQALSEQELAESLSIEYVRIPVQDDSGPTPSEVNRFVALVKRIKDNSWLHIHCLLGLGRTTTFLALYDIIVNAKQVSLEDIVVRQKLIGGVDLFKVTSSDLERQVLYSKRLALITQFYKYCKMNSDGYKTPFVLDMQSRDE